MGVGIVKAVCCWQLLQWLETLRSGGGVAAADDTPEAARRALEQGAQHRAASLDACAATLAQGDALLQDLRSVARSPATHTTPTTGAYRLAAHCDSTGVASV